MLPDGRGGPDIDGLRDFAASADREPARFFAGRTAQVADIERCLDRALRRYRAGELAPAAGATRLIRGAPGAGKTALLWHLAERWRQSAADLEFAAPVGVAVDIDELNDPEVLAGRILEAVAPRRKAALRQTTTTGRQGGFSIPGLRLGGSRSVTLTPSAAWTELRALDWSRPVCLLIDEVQVIRSAGVEQLMKYHLGAHGLPLVPVLAGLGDSARVLADHGLSRISDDFIHTLECLAPEEALDSARRFLAGFRVDVEGAPADWPERLAALSDGWPMHLHNGLRPLAAALAECGGRLAAVDQAAVEAEGARHRHRAYAARCVGDLDRTRFLLAETLADLPPDGATASEVVAAIERCARPGDPDPAWRLPQGMDADDLFALMVRRGVLQSDRYGTLYDCPIPSFRAWLAEHSRPAPDHPEP